MKRTLLIIILSMLTGGSLLAQNSSGAKMVLVKGGTYTPLYGTDSLAVNVQPFYIDPYPVTNGEFEAFIKKYPQWQKSSVKKLFADGHYLKHWMGDNNIGEHADKIRNSPVIYVSWFAAKAYCECQGKRLPTVDEWEFAAIASENKPNAADEESFYQRSLEWYSKPNPKFLPSVETGFKNYYGVYGMIGMVWEWTLNFNSSMLIGESRANASLDRQLFCGAGSSGAKDVKNYVAFMRYAFRSSVKANYNVSNLGFRCAKDGGLEMM
jgi:formylglycine-generating enzyme